MKPQPLLQRLSRAVLIASTAALLFAVAFPHIHGFASSHREESCRACKIQEGFSASAPVAEALPVQSDLRVAALLDPIQAPCLDKVYARYAPRSPPSLS